MATVKVKQTIYSEVTFPDEYGYDDSLLGRLVDLMLILDGYREEYRLRLFNEEYAENAIDVLDDYYAKAKKIINFLTENGHVVS